MLDEKHGRKWQTFLHHPMIHTYILKFKEQLDCNPYLEVATFFVIASLLTPILLFVVFAVISATVVFVSFMMIQGENYVHFLLDKIIKLNFYKYMLQFQ